MTHYPDPADSHALKRRSFIGILAAVLVQGRGWETVADIPAAPSGFKWRRAESLQAHVLVPDGWHLREDLDDATSKMVYITQPDSAANCPTQFAINSVSRMETGNLPITEWCKAFLMVCLEGQTPLIMFNDETAPLPTYCVEKIDPANEHRPERRIRIQGVANPATDTLYLVQFESAANIWSEAWKTGRVIYDALSLNEAI